VVVVGVDGGACENQGVELSAHGGEVVGGGGATVGAGDGEGA